MPEWRHCDAAILKLKSHKVLRDTKTIDDTVSGFMEDIEDGVERSSRRHNTDIANSDSGLLGFSREIVQRFWSEKRISHSLGMEECAI
jgi:hypothetical protein